MSLCPLGLIAHGLGSCLQRLPSRESVGHGRLFQRDARDERGYCVRPATESTCRARRAIGAAGYDPNPQPLLAFTASVTVQKSGFSAVGTSEFLLL